ncbi:hypothetical protein EV183_002392 [Coemansia sp. RSA 2336]|nr:hypothetical protein EV183_002392 [Coemansia sp. RSA 2336]
MYLIAGRRRGSGTATPKQTSASEPEYDETAASAPPAVDAPDADQPDDVGEFDDADLQDPELLSELEALRSEMGMAAPASAQPAAKEAASAATNPAAHASQLPADHDADVSEEEDVTEADMNDPELLAQLSQLTGTSSKPSASEPPKPAASEPPKPPAAIDEQLASALDARCLDFKQAALSAKRQGQMERARGMLVEMKKMQAAAKAVRRGEQLPSDFVIPSVPAEEPAQQAAPTRMQTETARNVQPKSAARVQPKDPARRVEARAVSRAEPGRAGSRCPPTAAAAAARAELSQVTLEDDTEALKLLATSIEALEKQLSDQAAEATRLAAYFLKSGDKTRALEFHRLRKQAVADMATVQSLAANKQAAPPILHREVQWRQPAEQRRDIGAGQLQVAVDRVFSEGDLTATFNGRSDFYVQWSLPWPRDKGTRGYTPTLKLRDFEASKGDLPVNYTHSIDMVDRRNTRPLLRWAERARLTVELYKYAGLLWGSQLIGRAVLPLAALRSQSEVSAVLPIEPVSGSLTRAGRPLPGGPVFVHVAARLRLPLSNSPETINQKQPESVRKPEQDMDDLEVQMDQMDGLVSNAVLDMELQQIPARIQAAGSDSEVVGHLQDLEAAIDLRKTVVATLVGAGTLTVQGYMDSVAQEITQARQWALAAKRGGRKDLAVRALQRIKTMQNEINEMKAAMAGQ